MRSGDSTSRRDGSARAFAVLAAASVAIGLGACSAITSFDNFTGSAEGGAPGSEGGASDGSAEGGPADSAACPGADLTQDPKNCGACGRDCLGGACASSACQPLTLAPARSKAKEGFALGADDVYWGDETGVVKCAKAGCNLAPQSVVAESSIAGIALLPNLLIWTSNERNAGALRKCDLPGCAVTVPMAAVDKSKDVTTDGTTIFWNREEMNGSVLSCPVSGCPGAPATVSNQSSPRAIAVHGPTLYWSADKVVTSCQKQGCTAPVPLFTSPSNVPAIAADDTGVYWVAEAADNGAVQSCPLAGCGGAPKTIADKMDSPRALALFGGSVYWANKGDRTIRTCAVSGCTGAPTVLATSASAPKWIAVDEKAVYWVSDDGSLAKLAR